VAQNNRVIIPRFFRDPNVRFPDKPVLSKGLSIRDVPRGLGINFSGGPRRFVLRGNSVARVFSFLLELLDGNRTLDDLLAVLPEEISPAVLFHTLEILHRQGVLVESEDLPDSRGRLTSAHRPSEQAQQLTEWFWARKLTVTRSADSVGVILQRIKTARVVAVINGLVGQLTAELLGRSGLTLSDSFTLDDFPALNDEILATRRADPRSIGTLEEFTEKLRYTLGLADLLVVSVHGATPVLAAALNDVCLESRTPLIFANEDGEEAEICFVDPYRSACLTCKDLRGALVSEFALEDYLFSAKDDSSDSWRPQGLPAGESVTAASLIAAHVVGEAFRYVSQGAPPVFVNRSLIIDVISGNSRLDPVLRVPRCPTCSHATLSGTL
jgi:hypothetical protein